MARQARMGSKMGLHLIESRLMRDRPRYPEKKMNVACGTGKNKKKKKTMGRIMGKPGKAL